MYFVLNFSPIIVEIFYAALTYFNITPKIISTPIAIIWMFVIMPTYLMLNNFFYINNKKTNYIKAYLLMIFIFIIRVGYMLIFHKIKYGEFIGDVPIEIYYFLAIIPSAIVLIGIVIHYIVKGK